MRIQLSRASWTSQGNLKFVLEGDPTANVPRVLSCFGVGQTHYRGAIQIRRHGENEFPVLEVRWIGFK